MFPTQSASQILPRLYLSGLCTAVDEAQLLSLRVTHILSIIEDRPLYPSALTEIKTMHIPLKDNSDVDILSHLDATTTFIKDALVDEKNIVLVHCALGISRSATVVCAYLIAEQDFDADGALSFVISKREIVCPNLGFRRQLEVFHTRLRGHGKQQWQPIAATLALFHTRLFCRRSRAR